MDLISLLIVIIVIGVIFYILQIIPIPNPWKTIAMVLVGLICIIYLLRMIGVVHI